MFSAFLALAFSLAVCIHLTIGFGGAKELARDAQKRFSEQLRVVSERGPERVREAFFRAFRRRATQES